MTQAIIRFVQEPAVRDTSHWNGSAAQIKALTATMVVDELVPLPELMQQVRAVAATHGFDPLGRAHLGSAHHYGIGVCLRTITFYERV